jgi:hypothetical protein
MKSFLPLAAIGFVFLLSLQSCLSCIKCKRVDKEARCIKPNDTLLFNQDVARYAVIQRFYNGGDSIFFHGSQGFEESVQEFTDSGYVCTVYATGNVSEVKQCNQAGEGDDNDLIPIGAYERWGYSCDEYKGH